MTAKQLFSGLLLAVISVSLQAQVINFDTLVSQAGGNANTAFNTLTSGATPVVIKFYIHHCPACDHMAPIFASASDTLSNQVIFVEINARNYRDISNRFSIRSVPNFVFFQNGQKVGQESSRNINTVPSFIARTKQYFNLP